MPQNTVYVGRPTKWGNKFVVGEKMNVWGLWITLTPKSAVWWFRWSCGNLPDWKINNIKNELRGKDLACWCKEGEPCHADVLLEIANA